MESVPSNNGVPPDPGRTAAIATAPPQRDDLFRALALVPPLAVRFVEGGAEAAPGRLGMLALAFAVAYGWSAIFERWSGRAGDQKVIMPQAGQLHFAMLFVLFLPGPVGWGGAVLSLSFGWIFGREIFGGKAILPPALVALAFAVFSFPGGGYEALSILSAAPDPWLAPWLALSCLPGAAWLLWKRLLPWRIAAGALAGTLAAIGAAALLMAAPLTLPWWQHFILGTFAIGMLFLAAVPEAAPRRESARWLHGAMVGALVILIRLANPDQPDGVIFAVLVGGLFAPLLDRALGWRPHRGTTGD